MSSLTTLITAHSLELGGQIARAHGVGAMNALITLTRQGTYDEVKREYDELSPQVIYDSTTTPGAGAIAGVAPTSGSTQLDLGDETQYYDSVTVYIPQDGPTQQPRVDDIVFVVDHPEDHIVGRYYRVVEAPVGGRIISSIMLRCVGVAPSRQWAT